MATILLTLAVAVILNPAAGQLLPSTYPNDYPGIPSGDYSPAWQSYFQVTESLPNVTFALGRSFAGNIAVQREGHPNNTLFFWAFENSNGSLTGETNDKPWGIWLNGGPGSSSLVGLTFENGPIHIGPDYSITPSDYSWDKVADYFWIDQPVGTGFSTADADGYVSDENQLGEDFWGFVRNLVKVFPNLATRPLHITGESYAGTFIPYIAKAYFGLSNPPTKLAGIAIGDGVLGNEQVYTLLPVVTVLETFPQVIGYDPDVYEYFKEQEHLCGFDLNLTYPQSGLIPTVNFKGPTNPHLTTYLQRYKGPFTKAAFIDRIASQYTTLPKRSFEVQEREASFRRWRRDLTGRANGTIDPWYGCDLFGEMIDYAINFTFPWTLGSSRFADGFDVYNVPDALSPEAPIDASVFLNDPRTRSAIHAPTSKDWELTFDFPFGEFGSHDPSPEPMTFLTDLATNATINSVSVVIYSGNNDALVPHRGSEVAIQNTTFGGIQGFSRKPSTPWFDDAGNFAGIIHQERNWTYVLFDDAGHLVPLSKPEAAFVFVREFVFGSNETGLLTDSSGTVSVIGGEASTLAGDFIPGKPPIYYGSGSTMSTYTFPSATIAAWDAYIRTADSGLATATATTRSASVRIGIPSVYLPVAVLAIFFVAL